MIYLCRILDPFMEETTKRTTKYAKKTGKKI